MPGNPVSFYRQDYYFSAHFSTGSACGHTDPRPVSAPIESNRLYYEMQNIDELKRFIPVSGDGLNRLAFDCVCFTAL